jgi:hypothetical protein
MNVLVLHNLANLTRSRVNITDYLFCFERYAPLHNYLYHRIMLPVTEAMRQFPFDAVIFDSTSLGAVTLRPRSLLQEIKGALTFLADAPAVKVAFPQDDYHHSDTLDELLCDLKCDAVFTPLIEHHHRLYPRTSAQTDFFGVLTGYVDDAQIDARALYAKRFCERTRRIVQRVTFYPPWGGSFSRIKGETAEMVKSAALARHLCGIDISTDPDDVLVGDAWFRLLGDAKFCLGAESGVSLWDRTGEILDCTRAYLAAYPDAGFAEVEAACFPGLDRQYTFSAISPRLFEAAQLRCCQILVEGKYLPGFEPYEHYIPLAADGSNLDEVFELIADERAAEGRAAAAYAVLIDNPDYRYSRLVTRVMRYLESKAPVREDGAAAAAGFADFKRTHRRELLEAVAARERGVGFYGQGLVDRVAMLLGDQFPETFFPSEAVGGLLADLTRELSAAQVRLAAAIECPVLLEAPRDLFRRYLSFAKSRARGSPGCSPRTLAAAIVLKGIRRISRTLRSERSA